MNTTCWNESKLNCFWHTVFGNKSPCFTRTGGHYPDLSSIYAKLKVNKSTVGGLPRSPCTCFDYLRTPHSFMTLPVYNLTHKIYSSFWFPTEEVKESIGAMLLY